MRGGFNRARHVVWEQLHETPAACNDIACMRRRGKRPRSSGIGLPRIAAGASHSLDELVEGKHVDRWEVRVEQHGDRFFVHAQSEVDADRATIWSTLTDYDHLANFIPNISSSRTISRNGAEAVVEQMGTASFGPMRKSFAVLFAIREQSGESITLSGVGDDFKRCDARYDIVSLTPYRSRIVYEATIVSRLPVPSIFSVPAMRSTISNQFGALIQEVLRRQTT